MPELSMIALAAWSLIPSAIFQIFDEFSNLGRHRSGLLSDNAGFLEAEISVLAIHRLTDNDMVQQLDLENPGSFANPAGEAQIGFARAGVPRRVIVLCGLNRYVM
jgi:hypothetical protein